MGARSQLAHLEGVAMVPKHPITKKIDGTVQEFSERLQPYEVSLGAERLIFEDKRTGAQYCECHILGSKLVELATTDVPLDPEAT